MILAIVGATATGKSDLAVALARQLEGEVVNADAMQLYAGMDIGTAKLPLARRHGIRHHQLDVLDVREEASVATYQRHARRDLDAIAGRGRVPILCGGSGLYVRAALDALDIPPTDRTVRARLEQRAQAEGVESLYAALATSDPTAAAAIEPRNARRIVRALEVIELTGRPFSATMPTRASRLPTLTLGLRAESTLLDARVAARVDAMWREGLLDEVAALAAAGLREGRTARAAIGYAQALAHLDGDLTGAQARDLTVTATRRLVRRQRSWFRADDRIHWLDTDDADTPAGRQRLVDAALAAWHTATAAVGGDARAGQ